MGKKKKKKDSNAVKMQKNPISINIFIDGKPLCSSPLSIMKKTISESGDNPFSC